MTLINSTVTGNSTSGNLATGGGIAVYSPNADPLVTIHNSIVAGNTAWEPSPDLFFDHESPLDVRFSLIGNNAGTTLAEVQTPDANGNLIGNSAGGGVIDPLLAVLADNGGPTQTHALLPNSPASNAGDPAFDPNVFTPPLVNDQRGAGFDRVIGGRIDIGAFEDQNPPPQTPMDIDANGNVVDEGAAAGATVGITVNAIDPGDTVTYSLTDNAGGRFQIHAGTGVVTVQDSSTFDGPDSYTITVEAEDQGGATSTADFTINVLNVAPSLSPLTVTQSTVTEGNSTTVQGSFTDGALGVASESFTGTATWSDGATTPVIINTDGTFSSTRTFDDDNPTGTASDVFTVSITISDDDGGSDTAVSPTVTVLNTAPVIGALSLTQSTVQESFSTTVNGSFTDGALGVVSETFTATATWSDSVVTPVTLNADGTFSTSRFFDDDNPTGTSSDDFTVSITISDDDGGSDTAVSPTMTVLNAAPVIGPLSVTQSTVQESFSTTVNGSFTDQALGVASETFTATATWSDSVVTPVTINPDGTFSTARFFDDDNPSGTPSDDYTVTITITDDDGGSDTAVSPTVTVLNTAPVMSTLSVTQSTVVESFSTMVTGSFTDLALGVASETFTATATWSDSVATPVTLNANGTFSTSRFFDDDNPSGTPSDDYTVTITIFDDDGGSGSAVSPVVTVLNAAPMIDSLDSLVTGDNVSISGTFSDFGVLDTHTISVSWGDGTPLESINLNQAAGTFDGQHTYSLAGDYTINVAITDDDGGSTGQSIIVAVDSSTLLGDYNSDNVVDAADYTVWQDTLGSTADLRADGDGDGTIDSDDYDVWKANFGNTISSSTLTILAISAVDEPTIESAASLANVSLEEETPVVTPVDIPSSPVAARDIALAIFAEPFTRNGRHAVRARLPARPAALDTVRTAAAPLVEQVFSEPVGDKVFALNELFAKSHIDQDDDALTSPTKVSEETETDDSWLSKELLELVFS